MEVDLGRRCIRCQSDVVEFDPVVGTGLETEFLEGREWAVKAVRGAGEFVPTVGIAAGVSYLSVLGDANNANIEGPLAAIEIVHHG